MPDDKIVEINQLALKRAKAGYEIMKDNGNVPVDNALFQHSVLCQTFFPYKSQDKTEEPHLWERDQGRASLIIQSLEQKNPHTGERVNLGVPYGAKIRLIMAFINTEIVRKQSATVEVADSMTAFIRNDLKLNTDGHTIRQVKNQLARLAGCTMSIFLGDEETEQVKVKRVNLVEGYDLWFPKSEDQKVLWNSYIEVSKKYTEELLEHAIPLDMRAVAALANNPLAIDTYSWLVYRLHRIPRNRPQFISWAALYQQFGFGYSRIRDFRAKFETALKQVKLVYPDARIEVASHKSGMPAGLMLHNSPTAIGQKLYIPAHLKRLKDAIKKRDQEKKDPKK